MEDTNHELSKQTTPQEKTKSQNVLKVHENLTEDDLFVVDIEQLLSDEAITFGAIDHSKPPVKPMPLPVPYGDKLYEIQYEEYLAHKKEYSRIQLEKDTDQQLKDQLQMHEPGFERVWNAAYKDFDMVRDARKAIQETVERSAAGVTENVQNAVDIYNNVPAETATKVSEVSPKPLNTADIFEVSDEEDENPFAQFDGGVSAFSRPKQNQKFNPYMVSIYPYYNIRQPRSSVQSRMVQPAFPIAPYTRVPVTFDPNMTADEMMVQLSTIASDPSNKILSPLTITMMQHTASMTLPQHVFEKVMELGLARASVSYLGGAVIGGMFGLFFGSMGMFGAPGSAVGDAQKTTMKVVKETFQQMWRTTASQSKFFAKMSYLFAGSEYMIAWVRARHDPWNPILSGCFTGYIIASSNSITRKAGSCAAFAAFSAVIEYVDFMALMTGE